MLDLQTSFPTVYESNKIFVRQCYSELYDIIQSSATVGGFVITGTPGIGKSVCSLYFLYKLVSCGKTVVFHKEDIIYRYLPGEAVKIGSRLEFKVAGYFEEKVL
jgi:hypothetical protein